jgi:hypothetical protein
MYTSEMQRCGWVAERLHGQVWGPRHVQQILDNVTHIIRQVGYLDSLYEKLHRRQVVHEAIRQVVIEDSCAEIAA